MNELENRPALPARCGPIAIGHLGYDRDRVRGFGDPKFHHRGHGRLSGKQGGGVYSSSPPLVEKITAGGGGIRWTAYWLIAAVTTAVCRSNSPSCHSRVRAQARVSCGHVVTRD